MFVELSMNRRTSIPNTKWQGRRASRNRKRSVQHIPKRVSHQYVRVHGDPSFMLRVGVGARGRRYQYTYGTSRIRPTVAKVTKVESREFRRIHRMAWRASTWLTSARAIKDGTSARSSSSTGRLTVTRTVPGSTWMSTVSTFHLRTIMLRYRFSSLTDRLVESRYITPTTITCLDIGELSIAVRCIDSEDSTRTINLIARFPICQLTSEYLGGLLYLKSWRSRFTLDRSWSARKFYLRKVTGSKNAITRRYNID